ncbi:hypothetical protein [Chamaesiphon polymorphus]|uniref:hypothetical protein n=1 Tax=Chamaesiphon polymorphus TaxID=2107691 RepID=UPI0011B25C51|nr:hypothetical protein [Chamaesiphon polymorphus]
MRIENCGLIFLLTERLRQRTGLSCRTQTGGNLPFDAPLPSMKINQAADGIALMFPQRSTKQRIDFLLTERLRQRIGFPDRGAPLLHMCCTKNY